MNGRKMIPSSGHSQLPSNGASQPDGLPARVRHLVDCDRDHQNQSVVLPGGNLDAIAVTKPEPFLRDLCHLGSARFDRVLVVENVALDL